jgi:transcriptional regulator with XRE-family HTH domain
MPSLGSVFARNVRAERVRAGLDQEQLGKRIIGLDGKPWSRSKVSDLETGRRKVTADDLAPVCAALGLSLLQLAQGLDKSDLSTLGL